MQTIVQQLDQAFRKAIVAAFGFDADPQVAPSQNEKFGDYQANAAMSLAREVSQRTGQKTNPRVVAEQIKAKLELGEMASEMSIAGPGFINVRLAPQWLGQAAISVAQDPRLGVEKSEQPQRVVVDYSAPNVAKELHVGHLRSTIIGDAIGNVLEFQGQEVIRQNHIGDWGTQFGMLITYLRESGQQGVSQIGDLNSLYQAANKRFKESPEFADEARRTVVRLQGGAAEEVELWTRLVDVSRRYYESIYRQLNVKLARADERGESFYNPLLPGVVEDLTQRGIATQSDGATVVFVEGFENPAIIEKTGGGYLYATTDLAGIRFRVTELKAHRIIYVVGAPQSQHFAQVFATARRAGWATDVTLEHAAFGSVLGEDGKLFRGRDGNAVKLKDLLDEAELRAYALVTDKNPALAEEQRREIGHAVGVGAVKYADLSKDRTSDYVFSWNNMLAMDGNTAPYLQYAYARIRSIFRKAASAPDGGEIRVESPFEIALVKHILRLGEVVELVARELRPHYLCQYLYELATRFSGFYENCPVLQSQEPMRSSRLLLCDLTARTMALGLELLGIEHPEQM